MIDKEIERAKECAQTANDELARWNDEGGLIQLLRERHKNRRLFKESS